MTNTLHRGDIPANLSFGNSVAIDTESMGLDPHRDRLCLVQLSAGDGNAHMVQLLPGIATASEAMALIERGYEFAKLFPAEASGGTALLSALAGPLPHVKFCPTGGVTLENAPKYLKLPNVVCVGGSWMVPRAAIEAGDWEGLTMAASAAAALHVHRTP